MLIPQLVWCMSLDPHYDPSSFCRCQADFSTCEAARAAQLAEMLTWVVDAGRRRGECQIKTEYSSVALSLFS